MSKRLILTGTVLSGKQEGKKFVSLSWTKKQVRQKLGFIPYPGTLNLRLAVNDSHKLRKIVKESKPIVISPPEGFCRAIGFKASLEGHVEAAIIMPEVSEYPEDLLEVVAPVNLRENLSLRDGDAVQVEIVL